VGRNQRGFARSLAYSWEATNFSISGMQDRSTFELHSLLVILNLIQVYTKVEVNGEQHRDAPQLLASCIQIIFMKPDI
jgi:hypothetical protein